MRIVLVRMLPAKTELVELVCPIARLASGFTVVMFVAELLPKLGSNSKAVTLATFIAWPLVDATTEMVIVAVAP